MFTIEEDKLISSQYFLRKIQTIFSLIILPPVILALFTYLYHDKFRPETLEVGAVVHYVILGFVLGMTYLAYQNLFKGLKELQKQVDVSLRKRLVIYYKIVSRQLFVLTITIAVLSVAYLVTFDPYFFYLFLFVILFASLEWPTKHKIARHLRLKKDERNVIINQTEINE